MPGTGRTAPALRNCGASWLPTLWCRQTAQVLVPAVKNKLWALRGETVSPGGHPVAPSAKRPSVPGTENNLRGPGWPSPPTSPQDKLRQRQLPQDLEREDNEMILSSSLGGCHFGLGVLRRLSQTRRGWAVKHPGFLHSTCGFSKSAHNFSRIFFSVSWAHG